MKIFWENYLLFEQKDYFLLSAEESRKYKTLDGICQAIIDKLFDDFCMKRPKLFVGFYAQFQEKDAACAYTDISRNLSWIWFNIIDVSVNFEKLLEKTPEHEASHVFAHYFDTEEAEINSHGKLWQEVMRYTGKEPDLSFDREMSEDYTNFVKESLIKRFI